MVTYTEFIRQNLLSHERVMVIGVSSDLKVVPDLFAYVQKVYHLLICYKIAQNSSFLTKITGPYRAFKKKLFNFENDKI